MPGRPSAGALKEGALAALLTAFLALVGLLLPPPLQAVTSLVLAIPVLVLVVRYSFWEGFLASVGTMILLDLTAGPLQGTILWIQFAGLGLIYGQLFKVKAGMGQLLFWGTAVTALGLIFSLFILIWSGNYDVLDNVLNFQGSLNSFLQMSNQNGTLDDLARQGYNEEEIRRSLETALNLAKILLPSFLALSAFFTAAANLFTGKYVLQRLGLPVPTFKPFREWRLPWYLIWGVIAGLAFWQGGDLLDNKSVGVVGENILTFYAPFLIAIGLAVIIYYLQRWRVLPVYGILLAALALLNLLPTFLFLAVLGTFDTLFNYRRLPAVGEGGEGERKD